MDLFIAVVKDAIQVVTAVGAFGAAFYAVKARLAIEKHAVAAQGKDRVISDLVTVAGMEPEIAAAIAPLVTAVKATAGQLKTAPITVTVAAAPVVSTPPAEVI